MITMSEAISLPGESPNSGSIALPQPAAQQRQRWFQRKRVAIPLVLLLLVTSVGGYLGWRVYDSFTTINAVSTPPPAVSGIALGGKVDSQIDTAPAVAAVQTYEAAKSEAASSGQQDPDDTANGAALVATSTTEVAPTATAEATETANEGTFTESSGQSTDPTATVSGESGETTDREQEQEQEQDDVQVATEAPAESAVEVPVLPQPTQVLPAYGENSLDILLMGVDALEGESIDIGVRPDALAVLHLDRETGACRMLAIPRDTRVELPGYGQSKINHALAVGGVPYQEQVVEQYLGVELDHYGLIDFGGVVKIVDKVGGVEVDNPAAFTSLGLYFPAGVQTLDGEQALAYARFRSDSQGDFGRIGRQQEVLRAVMQKVSPGDLIGMIPEMLPLLQDHFRTDLSALDMADLARTYGQTCTYDTLDTSTIEGDTATHYDPMIELNLSYVIIDDAELQRKREWLLGED
jgi:LCP family protein required for cell wall assembly